jgi:hypothetical protein
MTGRLRSSVAGAAIVAASVLCAPAAHAQQAGIEVTVVDGEGAPVAGVEVVVENQAIGLASTLVTDARGMVRLDGVTTAGAYQVSVPAAPGFAPLAAQAIELRSNFTRSVILQLQPAAEAGPDAGFVVTAARAITGLNTSNAEISASLVREQLVALPIEGRDVIGALIRLPNVVPSTGFFPEAPSISINGSNGLDTN